MLAEMICALTVLMTVRHVRYQMQKLVGQSAELAATVLFLSAKVRELRALNNKLKVQNQYFRYEAAAAQRCVATHQKQQRRWRYMSAQAILC